MSTDPSGDWNVLLLAQENFKLHDKQNRTLHISLNSNIISLKFFSLQDWPEKKLIQKRCANHRCNQLSRWIMLVSGMIYVSSAQWKDSAQAKNIWGHLWGFGHWNLVGQHIIILYSVTLDLHLMFDCFYWIRCTLYL